MIRTYQLKREIAPCKNCADRHEACWGECEKYKQWKMMLDEANRRRREYREKSLAYYNPRIY
jgi:hypothetical protein